MDEISTVRPAEDASPADWLMPDALEDWAAFARWGPRSFAVHARVEFGADPYTGSVGDNTAVTDLARRTYAALATTTASPEKCWAAVWEGWATREPLPVAPRVEVPHREMLLFESSVEDLPDAQQVAWHEPHVGLWPIPQLSWPADQAWCVACEVDEDVAFTVGCSERTYEVLVAALAGTHTVRRASWGDPEPLYFEDSGEPIDPRGLGEPIPPGAPGFMRYGSVGLLGGLGLGGFHDGA